MRLKKLWPVFTLLVLVTLACATLAGGDSQEQVIPEENQPAQSSGEDSTQAGSGSEATAAPDTSDGNGENQDEGQSVGEPGGLFFPGSSLDLDDPALYNQTTDLESYRTTLLNTFEGVGADGVAVTGTVTMVGATQAEPYATTLEFFSEGNAMMGSGEVFTLTRILDTQYIAYSGLPCISGVPGGQDNPFELLLDNGSLLTGTSDFIEEETVNGVETYAFKITEENIDTQESAGSLIQNLSKGRLNMAVDGGYLVRLILQGSGTNEMLSQDPELEGDIYYELNYLDFNQPVDIQVPVSCMEGPSGENNYPMPDDASEIYQLGDIVSFKTGQSVAEATAFYQSEMQALGCSEGQEMGSEEGQILSFENCPDGNAQIVLAPEGDHTYVTILPMP